MTQQASSIGPPDAGARSLMPSSLAGNEHVEGEGTRERPPVTEPALQLPRGGKDIVHERREGAHGGDAPPAGARRLQTPGPAAPAYPPDAPLRPPDPSGGPGGDDLPPGGPGVWLHEDGPAPGL